MPFGGLAPFPLRLGASSDVSISPENWLRLCSDAMAMFALPLAVLRIEEPDGVYGDCLVTGLSRAGTDPSFITVTVTKVGTLRRVIINVGAGYTDSTFSEERKWKAKQAVIRCLTSVKSFSPTISGNRILLQFGGLPETKQSYCAIIYGDVEQNQEGDYGAWQYKNAAKYAGDTPYASIWLSEFEKSRGDAFSTRAGSFTQMENIAQARSFGYLQSISERHAACQIPMQSDQNLGRHASVMDIGSADGKDWQVRNKCAAMYMLAASGTTEETLSSSAELIFGNNFHSMVWGGSDDEESPALNTFWSANGHDGPGALNIDDATWSSPAFHLTINLIVANDVEMTRVSSLAKGDFDELLRKTLPPVITWDYVFNRDTGFNLGVDRMDKTAL